MTPAKLTVWTLLVVAVTYFTAIAFVAPRQADARAEMGTLEAAHAPAPPTRQHDLEAAFHACSTLTARLESDTESVWSQE